MKLKDNLLVMMQSHEIVPMYTIQVFSKLLVKSMVQYPRPWEGDALERGRHCRGRQTCTCEVHMVETPVHHIKWE
jgi:hypothetical protein